MYNQEMINAIFAHHVYDYCMVDNALNIVAYSEHAESYFDPVCFEAEEIHLLDAVPEFVGMETMLLALFQDASEKVHIPFVFKAPDQYITIRVAQSKDKQVLIVLFENVTDVAMARKTVVQTNNENILLLKEIEEKNRQLEMFNQEMQTLVAEEIKKNSEKQHMLELQTRHAQMGEMIAMITHQWKQPLSVMQTLGTLLKIKYASGKLTPKLFTQKIDNLLTQASFLNQTVNDFQKFFTPSKKKVHFEMKETLTSVLGLIEMEYALENIKIWFSQEDTVTVYGYENEYKQVILSLLQNAKEALIANTEKDRQIKIIIAKQDTKSLVRVEDNAGGISAEMLETLFRPYVTSKENGSGLGLHIAKSVIENNMQGKLWVQNTTEGACFYIML